jgi:hypothetical protein
MSKTCVNHKETPAITMCFQCHRPICKSCTVVTPQGSFCSSECGLLNREFKEKLKEPKPKDTTGFLTKTAAAFVLVVVFFMGIHWLASKVPKLKPIDMIGRILRVMGTKGAQR